MPAHDTFFLRGYGLKNLYPTFLTLNCFKGKSISKEIASAERASIAKTPRGLLCGEQINFGNAHDHNFGKSLLDSLPENGVAIMDRGFASHEFLQANMCQHIIGVHGIEKLVRC